MNESNSSELKSRTWADGRDLILERRIDSKPNKVYAAWTQPELIKQWFAPAPWSVSEARSDVRAGGSSVIVMRSPDGAEFPNRGVYLEVSPERRLVFTDAFVEAWTPSEKPFMTARFRTRWNGHALSRDGPPLVAGSGKARSHGISSGLGALRRTIGRAGQIIRVNRRTSA